jgi:WD40 repeat protein
VDLDQDGAIDLVVPSRSDNSVSILWGTPNGSFLPAMRIQAPGDQPNHVAVGDIDGDGRLDLAVAFNQSPFISVALAKGNREFAWEKDYPIAAKDADFVHLVDFDNDGALDFLTLSYGRVSVRRNQRIRRDADVAPFATSAASTLAWWRRAQPIGQQLPGHEGREVWSACFLSDGQTLATGGDDGNVRLWDIATWAEKPSRHTQGGFGVQRRRVTRESRFACLGRIRRGPHSLERQVRRTGLPAHPA